MKPKPPVLSVVDSSKSEMLDEEWAGWVRRLSATGVRVLLKQLEWLGVPRGLHHVLAHNLIDRRSAAIEAALLGLDCDCLPNCIVAAGTPGNGKTLGASMWLTCGVLGDPDDASVDGHMFVNASRLDGYSKEVDQLEAKCLDATRLALDDVGTGKSSSASAGRRIEDLLCQRIDREQPTFVTTNLAPEHFFALDTTNIEPDEIWPTLRTRNRLADRIAGDPVGWVTCLEPSRRGRIAP